MTRKYKLKEKIGSGGMAEVYRAELVGVGGFTKPVAIKRLLPSLTSDKKLLGMLIDEARILSSLTHPNIVQVHSFERLEKQYLLIMEYVHGRSLADMLGQFREQGRDVPFSVAAHIASEAATGLAYAHKKRDENGRPLRIVHRDISPDNILLSLEGQVKVVDFGIAKAVDRTTQTALGRIKGKTFYMAPERLKKKPVDGRVDIFAIGLLIHEMLTGTRLFARTVEPEVFFAIMNWEGLPATDRPAGVPAELWRITARALAPEPDQRYLLADELAEELNGFRKSVSSVPGSHELADLIHSLFGDQLTSPPHETTIEAMGEQDSVFIQESEISGLITKPERELPSIPARVPAGAKDDTGATAPFRSSSPPPMPAKESQVAGAGDKDGEHGELFDDSFEDGETVDEVPSFLKSLASEELAPGEAQTARGATQADSFENPFEEEDTKDEISAVGRRYDKDHSIPDLSASLATLPAGSTDDSEVSFTEISGAATAPHRMTKRSTALVLWALIIVLSIVVVGLSYKLIVLGPDQGPVGSESVSEDNGNRPRDKVAPK